MCVDRNVSSNLFQLMLFVYMMKANIFECIARKEDVVISIKYNKYVNWALSFPWMNGFHKAVAWSLVVWKRVSEYIWNLYFVKLRSIWRLWLFSIVVVSCPLLLAEAYEYKTFYDWMVWLAFVVYSPVVVPWCGIP